MWKDEYVYGLWKGLMVPLLAWVALERQHQRASRAPSWSWASLDGPITLRILTQEEAIFLRAEFRLGEYPVRISLSCKLLTEKAISRYPGLMEFRDLDDEYSDNRSNYLLLCMKKSKKCISHWGLMVISIANGLFTRIGSFVHYCEASDIWNSTERQEVVLI